MFDDVFTMILMAWAMRKLLKLLLKERRFFGVEMAKLRNWLIYVSFAAAFASYFFTLGVVLWIFFVGPVVAWEENRAIITLETLWFVISLPFFLRILVRGAMRSFS